MVIARKKDSKDYFHESKKVVKKESERKKKGVTNCKSKGKQQKAREDSKIIVAGKSGRSRDDNERLPRDAMVHVM